MNRTFYEENRKALYAHIEDGAMVIAFAGCAPRKTADAYYTYFANRNYVYLTGLGDASAARSVFVAEKAGNEVRECAYILPQDDHLEKWNGRRIRPDEVIALSGIQYSAPLERLDSALEAALNSGRIRTIWLDLDRLNGCPDETDAVAFAEEMHRKYPHIRICNMLPFLRTLRTIKKPCEIDAMRAAMEVTRAGILSMMRVSRPGMFEYEYKAAFDAELTRRGVLSAAFQPIISAGKNNFCIHYEAYTGQARDGDMMLCDVGAAWDYMCNDVSRGFPCNGKFSEKQRLLYTCAYNTSEYMFGIIAPGMPMADVDKTARKYCFEQLRAIGLVENFEDVGKLIWHGGAHHVGFDVHDVVDMTMPVAPGMVFCVDIGIYCEEWGIGFRLEDNCLVTDTGCENLSRAIPRSISEIEDAMDD